jgi:ATP-dependent DNA ligase
MSVDARFAPMEMRSAAEIPDGPHWQYEPKWDGFRALAHRDGDEVALTSKNGQPLARYFPEIVDALRALPADRFSLDGELVVPQAGALSFDALQQRIHPATSRVTMLARSTPARYLAFDLLRSEGTDRIARPLSERRALLEAFARSFAAGGLLRLSPATKRRDVVDAWFARVGGALDGVIAKRDDLPYASGKRDAAVKVKQVRTADCVVGGFRRATGSQPRVASLLLGLYDDAGLLDYVGFCSAFAAIERGELLDRLAPLGGGSGFTGAAPGSTPSRWSRDPARDRSYTPLRPELVLEVAFDQVTGGRIRHGTRPVRWRTDKSPRACTFDQLAVAGSALELIDAP